MTMSKFICSLCKVLISSLNKVKINFFLQFLNYVYISSIFNQVIWSFLHSNDFRDYAELCFSKFGDRVKHWITLNEPLSYAGGVYVVGRCSKSSSTNCSGGDSSTDPYTVGHYQLLAHAAAVEVYRQKFQVNLYI